MLPETLCFRVVRPSVRAYARACVRMDAFYERIAIGIQFTTTVTFAAIKATSLVNKND